MEQVYAFGVNIIEFVQYWFEDWAWYLEKVNELSNPHFLLEVLFPLVSVVDSVFAAQLLLVLGFGGWLNSVMKWWFLEDRPYWWVRETSFYQDSRPRLLQTRQTCEAGPGSPSGHSAAAASTLLLAGMWVAHIIRDRKCSVHWWKHALCPLGAALLASVMLARLYVAAHFPHQCLLGALVGAFLAPALCIYVADPVIWRYGALAETGAGAGASAGAWRACCVLLIAIISAITYYSLELCGLDPQWTVKLALRWCECPENIHLSTTPVFALVQTIAVIVSWGVSVSPEVAKYRHDTAQRSLIISSFATGAVLYAFQQVSLNVDKTDTLGYYATLFALTAIKPFLLLRVTPALAMWPYSYKNKID